ncbi:hypothetical protein AMELA_G00057680 [Ameiurus melas]|uniref:C-C motif chemokine n=1 Tax=Ameiurus melas TaxID=219545 RepID=A0A7J6B2M3_AMEME|nr:hypothetical protein AMELA_G00057680 [Ameiurus melas]
MVSHSLLLVLLVLASVQSFTAAPNAIGPDRCCFSYQTHRIPVRLITAYNETARQCIKPGVIFTLKEGKYVCADPSVKWVQYSINKLRQVSLH